jgi:hypothetical protein
VGKALGVAKGEVDTDREIVGETLAVSEDQALGVVKGEEDNLEDKEEELDRTRCDMEMARANRKCLGKELWRVRCVLAKRVNELERLKKLLAVTKRGAGKARRTRKRQRIV